MAVTFVAATSATASTGTLNINWPAGIQSGDLAILVWNGDDAATWTNPAPLALLGSATSGGTQESRVYYRVCTGSETSPLALTQSTVNKQSAIIVVYRGVSTTTPIDAWASRTETTAGTTHANPQVTTVAANAPAVTFIQERATDSSTNYTPPAGYTKRAQPTPVGSNGSTSTAAADDGLAVVRPAGTLFAPPAWSNGISTDNVITWTLTLTPAAGGTSRSGTGTGSATATGTSTGNKSAAGTGSGSAVDTAAGTGTKGGYGAGTAAAVASGTGTGFTTKVNWQVQVDWDGDGFTAADDVTERVLARGGLAMQYGRDQNRELSPTAAGSGDLELDNKSRDYSPDNLASPLAGRLRPARPVRVRATSGTTALNENPTFDSGIAGWTAHLCSIAYSTTVVHPDGAGSIQITPTGGNPACGAGSALVPVTPLAGYTASMWAYSPAGWNDIRVLINWHDSAEAFLGSSLGAATEVPAGAWTEVAWTFTAPEPAAFASVWMWQSGNPTPGDVWYGWDVRFAPDESVATLMQGFIDDYDLKPAPKERAVALTLLDAVAKLRGAKATTRLYQGIRTGTAIGLVLDAIGWPSHLRDIDPGATTVRWWWVENTDAFEAVQDLVRAEGPPAMLTSDELGRIVFRDRHHRILDPRSTRAYATFTDQPSDPLYMMDLTYDHGWGDIVNSVSVKVEEKDPAATWEQVWAEESLIQLGANEVRTIRPTLTSPAVRPFAIYGVRAGGSVSHSLSVDSGQTLTLTLTAGAAGAIVTDLSIQAQPVQTARSYTILLEDADSIAEYGKRSLEYEVPWAGVHDATAVAELVLAASAQRRPIVTISLQSMTHGMTPRLAQQLTRNLSDRIHVRESETCVDHDFHVERIDHRVAAAGMSLETTFGLERAQAQADDVFRFDDPDHGFDDGVFASHGLVDPEDIFLFDVEGRGFDDGLFAT